MRIVELVIVLMLLLTIPADAQKAMSGVPNQSDSLGRKQGLWIEEDGLKEVYYHDGVKDGIYRSYYKKNRRLESFGEFSKDTPSGTWYYFDEIGYLILSESQIQVNSNLKVKRDDGKFIVPRLKSHVKIYHKNGQLCQEGIALYDEDIQVDYFMFGSWKYYNSKGKLIKEEQYKEGKVAL